MISRSPPPIADVRPNRSSMPVTLVAEHLLFVLASLVVVGCESQWEPPTTGVLLVSAETSGKSLDADGYKVVVDGGPGEAAVGIEGTAARTLDPEPQRYTVELSDIAPNCSVAGPNPRAVTVDAGGTTATTFEVTCTHVPREISFTSHRVNATDVYAVGLDEGDFAVRMTVSGATAPAWSPDGEKLARAEDTELWISDADGGNPRLLPITSGARIVEVVWSPDGALIMYSTRSWTWTNYPCGEKEAWMVDVDHGGSERFSSGTGTAWSPDRTKVVVTLPENPIDECPPTDIHLIDVAGSEDPVVLAGEPATEEGAVWSPDGTRIAFETDRDGNSEIYVMDTDGSNRMRLTTDPASDSDPAWSPDGERIAFTTTRDGNSEIYVMDADGSDPINLTNHPAWDGEPSWSQ